jgi:hypothetical protein
VLISPTYRVSQSQRGGLILQLHFKKQIVVSNDSVREKSIETDRPCAKNTVKTIKCDCSTKPLPAGFFS